MDEGGSGEDSLSLAVGYGCVIGRAETKAIAMSVLDRCLELGDKRFPTEDEEFVLVPRGRRGGYRLHLAPQAPALRDVPIEAFQRARYARRDP